MVHAAIEQIQPGEILVITMPEPGPVALLGDLLVTQAKMRGAAAILINAAVRDFDALVALGLPVWTRFLRVRGSTKTVVGEINVTVSLGGTKISPGDILVLDADGGVCIEQAAADEVLQASIERFEREEQLRGRFLDGEISYDIHGLRNVWRKNGGENDI
jgi:4-hydroxy-4-methyl-2-oxoglutarate aldolase